MTKTELIEALAKKLKTTKKQAGESVDIIFEEIMLCIKKGDKLTIPGFGSWGVKQRAARSGRNPQTGAPIKIAAATVPYFRAGSLLKAAAGKSKKK